jgi:hypothetical protein
MIATIALDDGLILPHSANPTGSNFRERHVIADGIVVGRIMKAAAAPEGTQWMWTLAYGYHEDRTPTHGYEATREAAMAAFGKSWRGRCYERPTVSAKPLGRSRTPAPLE